MKVGAVGSGSCRGRSSHRGIHGRFLEVMVIRGTQRGLQGEGGVKTAPGSGSSAGSADPPPAGTREWSGRSSLGPWGPSRLSPVPPSPDDHPPGAGLPDGFAEEPFEGKGGRAGLGGTRLLGGPLRLSSGAGPLPAGTGRGGAGSHRNWVPQSSGWGWRARAAGRTGRLVGLSLRKENLCVRRQQ